MDITILEIAARSAGVLPSAVEDAVRRLHGHFAAQADPTPELISQQLIQLREVAPHLFPRAETITASGVPPGVPESVWRGMAPSTKLTWAREHGQALGPVERRPQPITLSSTQAAHLATLPPAQRLAAYRELQDQGKG
jgi:hypothetical protein